MNLSLWLEEDEDVLKKEEQAAEKVADEKEKTKHKCACGRAVCCGRHKNGRCSCQNNQRQRS